MIHPVVDPPPLERTGLQVTGTLVRSFWKRRRFPILPGRVNLPAPCNLSPVTSKDFFMGNVPHNHQHERQEHEKKLQHREIDTSVPYWKRAHRDWRFWVALLLMLGAMVVNCHS